MIKIDDLECFSVVELYEEYNEKRIQKKYK